MYTKNNGEKFRLDQTDYWQTDPEYGHRVWEEL